jgi:regulatory protein
MNTRPSRFSYTSSNLAACPYPYPLMSLKSRALRYLSHREYSRAELEKKLKPFETSEGEILNVLDELQAKDFLNEKRHAQSLVNRRSEKLGLGRLKLEMRSKGVPEELVIESLQSILETEVQRAHALWLKKFGLLHPDPKEQARQSRFLISRGFSMDTVRAVFKQAALEPAESWDQEAPRLSGERSVSKRG